MSLFPVPFPVPIASVVMLLFPPSTAKVANGDAEGIDAVLLGIDVLPSVLNVGPAEAPNANADDAVGFPLVVGANPANAAGADVLGASLDWDNWLRNENGAGPGALPLSGWLGVAKVKGAELLCPKNPELFGSWVELMESSLPTTSPVVACDAGMGAPKEYFPNTGF